jgi:short-subunit dehydrogenase
MALYTLITGASGGIGEEFARQMASQGQNLILVARNEDKLNSLAQELRNKNKIRAEVIAQDLSLPGSAQKVLQTCQERNWVVDILVNNAGFGLVGPFLAHDFLRLTQMLELNVVTLTELTHLFLPAMIKARRGGVINVASTAAFQGVPYMSAYAASKAYVLHFSEGIHQEVKKSGVTVMALCPGATETDFFSVAGADAGRMKALMGTPDLVVQTALEGFASKRSFVVSGWKNRLAGMSVRLAPRDFVSRIGAKIFAPVSQ